METHIQEKTILDMIKDFQTAAPMISENTWVLQPFLQHLSDGACYLALPGI